MGVHVDSSSIPFDVTPDRAVPVVQAPVVADWSWSNPLRFAEQLLTFWTMNTVPLKVFSWKSLNFSKNRAALNRKPRRENLKPASHASTTSGAKRRFFASAFVGADSAVRRSDRSRL